MLQFERPEEPAAFQTDSKIQDAREKVRTLYEAALPTLNEDKKGPSFPDRISHWGAYKEHFARRQEGRCGFCELIVIGGQPGDVEHFYPKGAVRILDPENQGRERKDLSNVTGRQSLREFGTGYWWLAFEWENYLLACSTCNRTWKSDFFPVAGAPEDRSRPAEDNDETPLLLNPFDDDPGAHLGYHVDGTIHAKTPRGLATIETVGLWRPSLVNQRRKILRKVEARIREMNEGTPQQVRESVRAIIDFGDAEMFTFPGMVRIFFKDRTGIDWDRLTALAEG